ncbi:MAG: MFS transporter [Oscillospiraceae bacterium]
MAESLSSLLKVFSGYISDKFQKKKALAEVGYSTGILYKIALIFATSWLGILGARVIDRIGKGIRTAPRDVLVSESTDKNSMGKAFGIHKALDMAGAAIGIFITYVLLEKSNGDFEFKKLFLISVIPAILGLFMFIFIKETKIPIEHTNRERFWKNISKLQPQLKLYLFVAFLFTLGNSSNVFLLLKGKSIGFDDKSVILLYFIYNITAAGLSVPLGKLSDVIGRKSLLVCGYIVFSGVYLGFAFSQSKTFMVAMFVLYGVYTAMIAGVERAYIAEISPNNLKGTMLGLHSTISGIALLPASVVAGLLWTNVSAKAPFMFGAILSLVAAIILAIFMKNKKEEIS